MLFGSHVTVAVQNPSFPVRHFYYILLRKQMNLFDCGYDTQIREDFGWTWTGIHRLNRDFGTSGEPSRPKR